jgi:hypothetical protein
MNCKNAERMIDADDPERGIDDFALRSHLEECRSCRARFPEVLFLLREHGRAVEVRRQRSAPWRRFAIAAAAAIVLGLFFFSSSMRKLEPDSNAPRSATAPTESASESPISLAANDRSTAFGIEEAGTLRLGRHPRLVDSTTIGGVIRPAEIGPRHIPLPRKK